MSMAIRCKPYICFLVFLCGHIFCSSQAIAQDNGAASSAARPKRLTLVLGTMCEQIKENAPQNQAAVFPIGIGKVLCFSSFDPVPQETLIYHYWYHRDRYSTRMKLSLKPPRWSTFSSVHLREADKGPWHVEIRDEEGRVLRTLRFSITD
jgi:hypothetical protein